MEITNQHIEDQVHPKHHVQNTRISLLGLFVCHSPIWFYLQLVAHYPSIVSKTIKAEKLKKIEESLRTIIYLSCWGLNWDLLIFFVNIFTISMEIHGFEFHRIFFLQLICFVHVKEKQKRKKMGKIKTEYAQGEKENMVCNFCPLWKMNWITIKSKTMELFESWDCLMKQHLVLVLVLNLYMPWMDRLVFNIISIHFCNYGDKDAI